ncbi:carboxyl transferase domain-containing protein [Williamsia deligens]|uniref:Carboxyl transferase domain-containing protein n=1 Tax=Williamsia deligens TaxID=321325 RepID=A0ABW3G8G1_9NOCA|nr:carboxyl transferase domain-containing protein [Williamsia deligens]MCP2192774.1 acetyl-CoA carboxylase carboxyl transferase subunit beta [Williamsia deligens]
MNRRTAREVIDALADEGSVESWDTPIVDLPPEQSYADELRRARETTGVDESVLTACVRIRGHRVAVVVSEFGFLAGSIGRDAGARMAAAIRRATAERLPVVALPASGGTRMQEGTPAFLQMVPVTAAVVAHKAAHLPYLVHLRHPTTGGVFASWASLGHVTLAEPNALVGFLGPRVYEGLYGEAFPDGVQRAENLRAHGLADLVLDVDGLATVVDAVLRIVGARPAAVDALAAPASVPLQSGSAWDVVTASRRGDRPGVREVLSRIASDVVDLSGTGEGESDHGLLVALVRLDDTGVVIVGQDRRLQRPGSRLGPAALRVARRGMQIAADLRLPLVTVVDTPGADLSVEAEEGGLAGEIARCLADLISLPVPTVSMLLGEGAGGAALALLPADRVIAASGAWLAPLPPEGASLIVFRDTDHADVLAERQGIRAHALAARGIVDHVVDEGDPARDPAGFARAIGAAITGAVAAVSSVPVADLVATRGDRLPP